MKAELDMKFLHRCKDNELYPTFTECKHYKRLRPKVRRSILTPPWKIVLATHTEKLKISIKIFKAIKRVSVRAPHD